LKPTPTTAITADFSKLARRQLGLSQRDVIEATGLPSYRLKQWEARGLEIDAADRLTLRNFYEERAEALGLSFDEAFGR
jgi:transcriptional regulator with XRE-family HTH domain